MILGSKSKMRLAELDERLANVLLEVALTKDFVVVCGHRNEADQNDAFKRKVSKVKWPDSKHNSLPSQAVDIAPCNSSGVIDWNDAPAFDRLAKVVLDVAQKQGVQLTWGGTFTKLVDRPHFELTT